MTDHWKVEQGDCRDIMRTLPDNSVDAIVSDPPYGLSFMGKAWDHGVPGVEFWTEALRVAKPGAHLVAFGGTRTYHRLAVAIEDAGWEVRDCLSYLYGSGFPKSLAVDKAIDKMDAAEEQMARRYRFTAWVRETGLTAKQINAATDTEMGHHYTTHPTQPAIMTLEHLDAVRHLIGEVPEWVERECAIRSVESKNYAEREVVGQKTAGMGTGKTFGMLQSEGDNANALKELDITAPATDAAKRWHGWGTALKPGWESIVWATKPLPQSSELDIILANLLEIEARLCLLSDAANVAMSLPLSRRDSPEVWRIARWTVADRDSMWADLSGRMGTLPCALAIATSLSIVTSWNSILADALTDANTFTTATPSSTTIDWKTLRSCLSALTPPTIIEAASNLHGLWWTAVPAARALNAAVASIASTRERSVLDAVTSAEQARCRAEGDQPFSTAWEPIILARKPLTGTVAANVTQYGTGAINVDGSRIGERWPANVLLDEDAARMLGEPSRFFYTAKVSRKEREAGLDGLANGHPTLKPIALMRWLCRLVTPPNGLILDPFNGSGSTGCAAVLEGFRYLGCELEAEYVEIARRRIAYWEGQKAEPDLFNA